MIEKKKKYKLSDFRYQLPKKFIDKPAFGSRHLELLKLGFLEDEIFETDQKINKISMLSKLKYRGYAGTPFAILTSAKVHCLNLRTQMPSRSANTVLRRQHVRADAHSNKR